MEASFVGEEARSAQDAAFERFYRRYGKHVYRYTLALLRNPADAEDVTQTTFLNAYRAMRQGQHPHKPHNWLIKIAHNACRSRYVTRSRRVAEVPLDEALDQLIVPEEEKPNVRAVLRALGRLPFNQRAALVMRELEGRSYAEIAQTLGVSVSAVEMLIFRARKSMRLRASSLRALGAVQLPASLASFGSSGGAAAVGAGGVAGVGIVKLVAALAAATGVVGASGGALIADAGNSVEPQEVRSPVTATVNDRAARSLSGTLGGRATATAARRKVPVTVRRASAPMAHVPSGGEADDRPSQEVSADERITGAESGSSQAGDQGGQGGGGGAASPVPAVNVPVPTPPVNLPQVPVPVPTPAVPPLPVEAPPLPEPPKLP